MRTIAMLLLALASGTASAIPVTASSYVEWLVTAATYAGGDSFDGGDPLVRAHTFNETAFSETELGSARASTSGGLYSSLASSDDRTSFAFWTEQTIAGEASIGLPPEAYAVADSRMWVMALDFEVFEPVLYNGSSPLEQFGTNIFNSGSILGPGRYTYWYEYEPSHRFHAVAEAGESFAFTTSRRFEFDFVTVPVPTPATGGLMLLGLLALVGRRQLTAK